MNDATQKDLEIASIVDQYALGVTGFPSVLLRKRGKMGLLTAGDRPYEHLAPTINAYFML